MSFDYQYRLKKIELAREKTNKLKSLISDFENALSVWEKNTQDNALHINALNDLSKIANYVQCDFKLMNLE